MKLQIIYIIQLQQSVEDTLFSLRLKIQFKFRLYKIVYESKSGLQKAHISFVFALKGKSYSRNPKAKAHLRSHPAHRFTLSTRVKYESYVHATNKSILNTRFENSYNTFKE